MGWITDWRIVSPTVKTKLPTAIALNYFLITNYNVVVVDTHYNPRTNMWGRKERKKVRKIVNKYILCIHGRTHNDSNSLCIAIFATQFGGKFGVVIRDYFIVLWVKKGNQTSIQEWNFVDRTFTSLGRIKTNWIVFCGEW